MVECVTGHYHVDWVCECFGVWPEGTPWALEEDASEVSKPGLSKAGLMLTCNHEK